MTDDPYAMDAPARTRQMANVDPTTVEAWHRRNGTGRNGNYGKEGGELIPKAPIPPTPTVEDRPLGWPVLSRDALHGPVGEAVELLRPHTEADPAAVLVTLLAGWGAIVGAGPHARGGHAKHPARLCPVIVGDTAKARKGTSWATAALLLEHVDPEFLGTRVLGGFGSGEAVVDEVRDPQPAEGDDKVGDVGAADKRLLIHEPEFARVLKVCARETSILSGIIRDAWDGSRLQTRSRAKKAVATGHHIAIIGHITAPELRRNLTETEIAGGFANRLLWVCAARSKRLPFDTAPDDAVVHALGRVLRDRAQQATQRGSKPVPFAEEARGRWEALYEEMAEDDPGGMLGAIVARPEPQTLRLAVTYALLDGRQEIATEHIDAAWAVWSYCRASAEYIWGDSVGDPLTDRLLSAIRKSGSDGLDRSEIRRVVGSNNVPAARIEGALKELEDRGLIETVTLPPQGGKGRPRTVSRQVTDRETSE